MVLSIQQRLSLATSAALAILLVASGLMLDRVFAISLESVVRDKLKIYTYVMLALAELEDDKISLPARLSEQRFNEPGSSLMAFVNDGRHTESWRSISAGNKSFNLPTVTDGEWLFGRAQDEHGGSYYVSVYSTVWHHNGEKKSFDFSVLEDQKAYQKWVRSYRTAVIIALGLFGLTLFIAQALVLRWSLKPLRSAALDVDAMNDGRLQMLPRDYSRELQPLTNSLNRLLKNESRQRERYRDRLADLSHSLKTPLTVLQGLPDDTDSDGQPLSRDKSMQAVSRLSGRMRDIIDYQLQRATVAQLSSATSATLITPHIQAIASALAKVYVEKNIEYSQNFDALLVFYGDENDLLELLGNLLDNAYKHCASRVRFSAFMHESVLSLQIDDDGDGVPMAQRESILRRGVRLDSTAEGQGFGLAIVADIVASYDGEIAVNESDLGGACFQVLLPSGH